MSFKVNLISHIQDISSKYPCILSDIWGVIHNGVEPYKQMGEMLASYRRKGGIVILVSNAPRPWQSVVTQLQAIGVCPDIYDAIATSGDLAAKEVEKRYDQKVYYIGVMTENLPFKLSDVAQISIEEADYIYCTGPYNDETDTAENYREVLEKALARNVPFICANPDLVVERGNEIVLCAGSIAQAYEEMGGEVFWAGKPYVPIYELARQWAGEVGKKNIHKDGMVAIGDAIRTDIQGAKNFGIDSILVTTGIHNDVFSNLLKHDDPASAYAWLEQQKAQPTYLLPVSG